MSSRCSTALNAETSRRAALFGIIGVLGSTLVGSPEEASARYSSYAHREQDWEERKTKGEVSFKTAKDLKSVRSKTTCSAYDDLTNRVISSTFIQSRIARDRPYE
jgi:hypothetical protein